MRRWWLVLALLLSVGINVGVLAVIALHRARPLRPGPLPAPPAAVAGVERIADHLGLEGGERERFMELQRGFFEETREGRLRMRALHRELRRELTARRPDRERVEAILAETSELYGELEGAFARLVLDTREVLDPGQQREYLRFLSRMRGGPEGRRRGPPPGRRLQPPESEAPREPPG